MTNEPASLAYYIEYICSLRGVLRRKFGLNFMSSYIELMQTRIKFAGQFCYRISNSGFRKIALIVLNIKHVD